MFNFGKSIILGCPQIVPCEVKFDGIAHLGKSFFLNLNYYFFNNLGAQIENWAKKIGHT